MEKAGISSIFVCHHGRLKGIVTAKACRAAADRGEKKLDGILDTDVQTVTPDTPANDLFSLLADPPHPVAVVADDGHLKGVIVAGLLMAKLSEVTNPETLNGFDAEA
jgi:glycine betaine/proline transport system ATP-binding protein